MKYQKMIQKKVRYGLIFESFNERVCDDFKRFKRLLYRKKILLNSTSQEFPFFFSSKKTCFFSQSNMEAIILSLISGDVLKMKFVRPNFQDIKKRLVIFDGLYATLHLIVLIDFSTVFFLNR